MIQTAHAGTRAGGAMSIHGLYYDRLIHQRR